MEPWIWFFSAFVLLLWLRLEVLFHKHDVLRTEHDKACSEGYRSLQDIRNDYLSWPEFSAFSQRIRDRLDKLDPPRRRATDKVCVADKKDEPCHCGPTADGYVRISPGCPHWNARAEYGAVPKKKAAKR